MKERIALPVHVAACCGRLRQTGHRACPVGGCVRDSLLGLEPGDWDVTTSASPEEILTLFPRSVLTGGAHGTVTVPAGDGVIEVTPFRGESGYSDGRHPDRVTFGVTLEEDLARRDFTVNAMALDEDGNVVDLFGGRADLERRLIRSVGSPERRFREDALRMFRAVRFSARLGFDIEGETLAAMARCAPLTGRLSAERVGAEMERTLCAPRAARAELWFRLGLLIPWLGENGFEGELDFLEKLPPEPALRWAGLCAALAGEETVTDTEEFMKGLRRDKRTVRLCASVVELLREGCPAEERGWRLALARYGGEVCRAAALLAGDTALERTLARRPCVRAADLALSGGELAELGLSGPEIGRAQRILLDRVLERPEWNTKERLREILEGMEHI